MNFGKVQGSFEAVAKQAGLLGTLFWWDLGNNRIEHRALVERADHAGLDKALLPSAVKPATAFKRAWRAAARRSSDDLLLREIAETPDQLVVAVVREHPDVLNLDLRYEVLARATFNKKTEAIALLEKHEILDGLGALCDHYSAITTEDIRAMVLGFVRTSGLSIRHAGGVYFIRRFSRTRFARSTRCCGRSAATQPGHSPSPTSAMRQQLSGRWRATHWTPRSVQSKLSSPRSTRAMWRRATARSNDGSRSSMSSAAGRTSWLVRSRSGPTRCLRSSSRSNPT